jgi:hypothetical protein
MITWQETVKRECICVNGAVTRLDNTISHENNCDGLHQKKLKQAEVSFKAGQQTIQDKVTELEKDLARCVIKLALTPQGITKERQEGRQEVVDWFYSHGYSGGAIHYGDGYSKHKQ